VHDAASRGSLRIAITTLPIGQKALPAAIADGNVLQIIVPARLLVMGAMGRYGIKGHSFFGESS
jgi:hypothetical protein